jgi:hypothetical protein
MGIKGDDEARTHFDNDSRLPPVSVFLLSRQPGNFFCAAKRRLARRRRKSASLGMTYWYGHFLRVSVVGSFAASGVLGKK